MKGQSDAPEGRRIRVWVEMRDEIRPRRSMNKINQIRIEPGRPVDGSKQVKGLKEAPGAAQVEAASVSRPYPPLSVGVSPKSVQSPTDMSRELRTVTTAARARPHFDFTMSIFPADRNHQDNDQMVSEDESQSRRSFLQHNLANLMSFPMKRRSRWRGAEGRLTEVHCVPARGLSLRREQPRHTCTREERGRCV